MPSLEDADRAERSRPGVSIDAPGRRAHCLVERIDGHQRLIVPLNVKHYALETQQLPTAATFRPLPVSQASVAQALSTQALIKA